MKGNGQAKILRGYITRLKPDTYSATAQAHHIVSPETAYVKGQKVIGTLQKKTLDAEKNGEYKAPEGTLYESVNVNVDIGIPDGYIKPSGTKEITENDEYDITEYAKVNVNVPIPEGYVIPEGEVTITENGEHDISGKAKAIVNVAGEETPYYDGTVIIEKAESVLGLRRFKEDYTAIEIEPETIDAEQFWNDYGFTIEPTDVVMNGVTLTLLGLGCWLYVPSQDDYGLPSKFTMDGTVYYTNFTRDDFASWGLDVFNVLSTANSTVDEWLLANTEGVSV